ncbi:hypothetical protein OKA04_03740 [Luteolibacter flavescens]|uniref:J domain-containing protein n=1 Tax=Luteolibacter flavescens TaxID=1859460 RepID=A0ABT3FLH3_9BACT|nr:hypothetical protein [Luteolibacter flavescens]MCW1883825.1 hypothetical protein [Luteolibacter flavescens]
MPRAKQFDLNLDLDLGPAPAAEPKTDLTITGPGSKLLSPAQKTFNRRVKALEKAREAYERKRGELDELLEISRLELMPLVEKLNQANRDLALQGDETRRTMKMTSRRHHWLGNLIFGKASELLADPVGLSDEDIGRLEALAEELKPAGSEEAGDEDDEMLDFLKHIAHEMGVAVDFDGAEDPEEVISRLQEAIMGNTGGMQPGGPAMPKRKPTKAALERARKQQELEEAKKRDFKGLYKQLAKVLHPDLEPDPVLKEHKEAWMKRLTAAHANGDLRDMLAIEMEWLGEESGNLANASDQKLLTYGMVLKEQTEELEIKTRELAYEPEYAPLARYMDIYGDIPHVRFIKIDLTDELERLEEMLAVLQGGGEEKRKMINQWADANARANTGR